MIERRNLPTLHHPRRRGHQNHVVAPPLMFRVLGNVIIFSGFVASLGSFIFLSFFTLEGKKSSHDLRHLHENLGPQQLQKVRLLQQQQPSKQVLSSTNTTSASPLPLPSPELAISLDLPPSSIRRINMLFDDTANPLLTKRIQERVPIKADDHRFHVGRRDVSVTILRPPGVLGSIMERFVIKCIMDNIDDERLRIDLSVVGTSRISQPPPPKPWGETKVHPEHYFIHVISQPLLLEAIDLALLTLDDKSHVALQSDGTPFSWQDLLDAVTLLVRWHCRVSELAKTLQQTDDAHYVMTLPLQSTLEHPLKAEIEIMDFLAVEPDSPPNFLYPNATRREDYIHSAWTRVHQAHSFLRIMDDAGLLPTPSWFSALLGTSSVDNILNEQVESVLKHEMPSLDQCPTDPSLHVPNTYSGRLRFMSPSVNSMQQLLVNDDRDASLVKICEQFPTLVLCRYKKDGRHHDFYHRLPSFAEGLLRDLRQDHKPNELFLSILCQGHPERVDLCGEPVVGNDKNSSSPVKSFLMGHPHEQQQETRTVDNRL